MKQWLANGAGKKGTGRLLSVQMQLQECTSERECNNEGIVGRRRDKGPIMISINMSRRIKLLSNKLLSTRVAIRSALPTCHSSLTIPFHGIA